MLDWNDVLLKAQYFAYVAGASSIVLAALWFSLRKSWTWLPLYRAPRLPWPDAIDFAFCFLLFQIVPGLVYAVLEVFGVFTWLDLPVEPPLRRALFVFPFALPIIVFRSVAMSRYRHDVELRHVGLTKVRLLQNAALGIIAFLVTAPAIFALHVALMPGEDHRFLTLARSGLSGLEWGLLGFLVLVFAPVVEEVWARGFLARWLEEAPPMHHFAIVTVLILLGLLFMGEGTHQYAPLITALVMAACYAGVLQWEVSRHAPLRPADDDVHSWEEQILEEEKAFQAKQAFQQKPGAVPMPFAGMFGSAGFFAMMHGADWPAPIALYFFALVAGWLAWRTRSLVGPMVFHSLFNLVSLLELVHFSQ